MYPFWVALVLVVWFETEAFPIYFGRVSAIGRLFKIDQYKEEQKTDLFLKYPDFLLEKYPSFFTKLLACPICFSFWLCVPSIACYGLFKFSLVMLISLLTYGATRKVLS